MEWISPSTSISDTPCCALGEGCWTWGRVNTVPVDSWLVRKPWDEHGPSVRVPRALFPGVGALEERFQQTVSEPKVWGEGTPREACSGCSPVCRTSQSL